MTQETIMQLFEQTVTKIKTMLDKKGHDYSKSEDRLSNFVTSAGITGINITIGVLYIMSIKISRLENLISSGKTAKNESIEDTAIDLITYAFLAYATLMDKWPKEYSEKDIEKILNEQPIPKYPEDKHSYLKDLNKILENQNELLRKHLLKYEKRTKY